MLAKPGAPGQTVQARVLPVSGVAARQGQQTIQVLYAILLRIPIFLTYLLFILIDIIFLIINTLPKLLPHKDDHNQVVAAPQGTVRGSSPSVSLDQLGRPQANALASALAAGNHVKIQAPTVSG